MVKVALFLLFRGPSPRVNTAGPKLQKDMAVLKVTTVGATWRNGSFSLSSQGTEDGSISHYGSMGLVYIPIQEYHKHQPNVGVHIYIPYMDPMGIPPN